jgi:type VI protein secretion system component Hcp
MQKCAAILATAVALTITSPLAWAGSKSGGVSHSDIQVTKQTDKATSKTTSSPKLYNSVSTGKHYKKATIN